MYQRRSREVKCTQILPRALATTPREMGREVVL